MKNEHDDLTRVDGPIVTPPDRATASEHEAIRTPVRVQRQRTKGWRMPENTVYVGRRRIGQLETKLEALDGKIIGQREWGELQNKVETLYRVYVLEALSKDRHGDTNQKRRGR